MILRPLWKPCREVSAFSNVHSLFTVRPPTSLLSLLGSKHSEHCIPLMRYPHVLIWFFERSTRRVSTKYFYKWISQKELYLVITYESSFSESKVNYFNNNYNIDINIRDFLTPFYWYPVNDLSAPSFLNKAFTSVNVLISQMEWVYLWLKVPTRK